MRVTSFVCSMSNTQNDIHKAMERFVSHCDSKQFVSAGVELGRLHELSNRLSNLCGLASDALWEDSRVGTKEIAS